MKNNFRLAALLMMISNLLFAQKDVKWTEPQPHPCFYGLKISVLNMGYQEAPKAYLWGIRITNNYRKAVTFRYRLIVGSESKSGDGVAWKLKPGATWTDGGDVFTGNMFQSPSANWKLTVSQVCFDGENCGGPNECYAECDRIQGNEYQPCDGKYDPSKNQQSADVTGTAQAPEGQKADKGYSGAFTEWRQEGKDVKLTIGQDNNGIYWKKNANEPTVLFKNIRQGTYRYEAGSDFFIIKFENDNRLSFWNNGSLVGYFTKPEEKKETAKTNPEEKKENVITKPNSNNNAGNQGSVFDGIWEIRKPIGFSYKDSTYYHKIEVVNNELLFYDYPSMQRLNKIKCFGKDILVRYLKIPPITYFDNATGSYTYKTAQNVFMSKVSECESGSNHWCNRPSGSGWQKGNGDSATGFIFISEDELEIRPFCCIDPYFTTHYVWKYKRVKK